MESLHQGCRFACRQVMPLACGVVLTQDLGRRESPPGLPLGCRVVVDLASGVALTRDVGGRELVPGLALACRVVWLSPAAGCCLSGENPH
jgi:hypothetical protein